MSVFGTKRLPIRDWRLPAGVRQSDCDGRPDALADASCADLWAAAGERGQGEIALEFGAACADDVRDALMDAQDGIGLGDVRADGAGKTRDQRRAEALGRALWPAWTAFRDQRLADLYRRGRIGS